MFRRTTAINKILSMTARKRVVQGGTWAGKTHGVIPAIINNCIVNPNWKATVVAESIPAVKDGAVTIFKSVMDDTNRWRDDGWIGNPMQYTFSNGSVMQFKSFDTVGKAKAAGKRDELFLNECNHIPYNIADALTTRSNICWYDFNPDELFYVHTEILQEPNSELLVLTYLDNECCPPHVIEELNIKMSKAFHDPSANWEDPLNVKNKFWANWCKVYIKGLPGKLEGIIHSFEIIESIPSDAKYKGTGVDFGYTNDPSVGLQMYEWGDAVIYDQIFYQTGMKDSDIAGIIKDQTNKSNVICDNDERLKDDIRARGVDIKSTKKGPGSVEAGISLMQERSMYITARSVESIKDFRRYRWDEDREGNKINKPVNAFKHAPDAARYIYAHTYSGKYSGKYSIH